MRYTGLFGLAALFAVSAVPAQAGQAADLGYAAIERGDWGTAESQLRAGLVAVPDDPMHMVNLAFVLQQQGKAGEAADLYRRVLEMKSNPRVAIGSEDRQRGVRVKSIATKGMAAIENGR
ncbi:MAG: hypothetical protein SFV21_19510 [Rhodospirillaceae bacterium]|nr:hypothetical protein [Rhodospirillaceae bacterium]